MEVGLAYMLVNVDVCNERISVMNYKNYYIPSLLT